MPIPCDPILVFIFGSILMLRGIAAIDTLPPERRETEPAKVHRQEKICAAAVPQEQLNAAEATRDCIAANYCNQLPLTVSAVRHRRPAAAR